MAKLSDHFERKSRENGESFVTLRDDAPEWLRDAVYEAHDGKLPNDWIYSECYAAVCAIEDGSLTEDNTHSHCDGQVDIYNNARFAWAAEFCNSNIFAEAEETAAELGSFGNSVTDTLGVIQFCAIGRIARIMLDAVAKHT